MTTPNTDKHTPGQWTDAEIEAEIQARVDSPARFFASVEVEACFRRAAAAYELGNLVRDAEDSIWWNDNYRATEGTEQ